MNATDRQSFLGPTEFIESDAPAIVGLAASLVREGQAQTAVALFDWVRDEVRYDPWAAADPRALYRATAVLERRRGYCVQKAVLLAALGRAAGIPTRLGFADVRNHQSPPALRAVMGTDLFVFHGFVELFLDGRWVKATPAFDARTTARAGVLPVTLDGTNDALLHPVDPEGHPFIEYVASRGSFADLPFDDLSKTLRETYAIG
jgi:transglutaminase-like putative cysteine protease